MDHNCTGVGCKTLGCDYQNIIYEDADSVVSNMELCCTFGANHVVCYRVRGHAGPHRGKRGNTKVEWSS